VIKTTVQPNYDTDAERRKASIVRLLQGLIEQVEADGMYGEFGITFTAQNGKIGHYEEHRKRSFK
jgi:hypothetical protein